MRKMPAMALTQIEKLRCLDSARWQMPWKGSGCGCPIRVLPIPEFIACLRISRPWSDMRRRPEFAPQIRRWRGAATLTEQIGSIRFSRFRSAGRIPDAARQIVQYKQRIAKLCRSGHSE